MNKQQGFQERTGNGKFNRISSLKSGERPVQKSETKLGNHE